MLVVPYAGVYQSIFAVSTRVALRSSAKQKPASAQPKTGIRNPRKDRNSGADSVRIYSARSADGVSGTSDFAARLEQFGCRNGLFEAEELAVLSDEVPCIRNACEEILA